MKRLKLDREETCGYLIGISVTELVGLLAQLVSGAGAGYEDSIKPPASPPGWVFPLVWALLYALIGAAVYRIWKLPARKERTAALVLWTAQLAVNFIWPIVFFRFHALGAAIGVLVLLLVLAVLTGLTFFRLNRRAGLLLAPYLCWLLFACYLNIGVYVLC